MCEIATAPVLTYHAFVVRAFMLPHPRTGAIDHIIKPEHPALRF